MTISITSTESRPEVKINVPVKIFYLLSTLYRIQRDIRFSVVRVENCSALFERSGNKIVIKGLPIADFNNPLLPSKYFQQIVRRIGDINIPDDILFSIFDFNISSRKEIIQEAELIDHEVSNMLSEIINYEINLISFYD